MNKNSIFKLTAITATWKEQERSAKLSIAISTDKITLLKNPLKLKVSKRVMDVFLLENGDKPIESLANWISDSNLQNVSFAIQEGDDGLVTNNETKRTGSGLHTTKNFIFSKLRAVKVDFKEKGTTKEMYDKEARNLFGSILNCGQKVDLAIIFVKDALNKEKSKQLLDCVVQYKEQLQVVVVGNVEATNNEKVCIEEVQVSYPVKNKFNNSNEQKTLFA